MGRVKSLRLAEHRLFVGLFTLAYFLAFILTVVTWLLPSEASAANLTVKSITMSTSAASAQAEYSLTFTPATTYTTNATSMIVDFCANDPLITDTCTFAATTVPTVSSGITSSLGTAGVMGSGSPIHTISVTTITGGFPAGPITFNFDATPSAHLTNPTTNVSFYARIITWEGVSAATAATSDYSPANTSGNTPTAVSYTDSGGVALSTAASIGITADVYETLSFCVFTTACGTTPALILGSATTGALSTSSAYVNSNTQYTIASNADTSVGVAMAGTTLCRSSGATNCQPGGGGYSANTITPTGNAAVISAVGTAQFGMCVDTNGATNLVAVAPYLDSVNNCNSGLATGVYSGSSKFGFNDSTSNGTNAAGGDEIMSTSSTGVIPSYTGTLSFLGNIAAATSSGIYTTSLNLVATGTF